MNIQTVTWSGRELGTAYNVPNSASRHFRAGQAAGRKNARPNPYSMDLPLYAMGYWSGQDDRHTAAVVVLALSMMVLIGLFTWLVLPALV